MITKSLRDYMAAKIEVVDALSHPVHGFRWYGRRSPQGVPGPLVLTQQIGSTPHDKLDGESCLAEQVVEITVQADVEHLAASILELIRLAPLSGYRGTFGDVYCNLAKLDSTRQSETPRRDGSDGSVFISQADYRIFYQQTQPVIT